MLAPAALPGLGAVVSSLPAGVTAGSGVALNAAQVDFLRRLRARVPADVPLHVTSGTRTAEDQARALVTKRDLGDDLRALYRSNRAVIDEVLAVPNRVDAIAAVLRRNAQAGRVLSRHMRGDAVDLRNRNLNPAQRQTILAAAGALGAKAFEEAKPPHIHIEGIGGGEWSPLTLYGSGGPLPGSGLSVYPSAWIVYAAGAAITLAVVAVTVTLRKRRSPAP